MNCLEMYDYLNKTFDPHREEINLKDTKTQILNIPFESYNYNILPGESGYRCNYHNKTFTNDNPRSLASSSELCNKILGIDDSKIAENINFSYSLVKNKKSIKSDGVIFLLHGLNEKGWDKYLPWAIKLHEQTGKSIILFPNAFHMNRTPAQWSDPRLMTKITKERENQYPNVVRSSFANAATSTRLQTNPSRFLWSGLQTYYDIIQLVSEIRSDTHPYISKDASIDFFSYSIGAFLGQILLMTNANNFFVDSRLFIFCGGSIFNRMTPVSKYIIDSEANIALYTFFIEHFEKELNKDNRLAHYFSGFHPEGNYFRAMLDIHKLKDFRNKRLHELHEQIMAIVLAKDQVIRPYEVINSLQGEERNIPIKVKIMDFPYSYDHVMPFPISKEHSREINRAFNKVFSIGGKFLK